MIKIPIPVFVQQPGYQTLEDNIGSQFV